MFPSAAEYSILTSEDPFDQELTQALGPLLEPIATLLSRTPAVSNLLGGPFGVNSSLVRVRFTRFRRTEIYTRFCGGQQSHPVLICWMKYTPSNPCHGRQHRLEARSDETRCIRDTPNSCRVEESVMSVRYRWNGLRM